MRLLDSSAWIEYVRRTGSRADGEVTALLRDPAEIATTEPVVMEVLAGARGESALRALERLMSSLVLLPVERALDFHEAARFFRMARSRGRRVRKLNDCLIAAVALRHDVAVVHRDVDYEVIAAVTGLRTQSLL